MKTASSSHSRVSSILKTADIYITFSMKNLIKIATNIVCSTAQPGEDLQLTIQHTLLTSFETTWWWRRRRKVYRSFNFLLLHEIDSSIGRLGHPNIISYYVTIVYCDHSVKRDKHKNIIHNYNTTYLQRLQFTHHFHSMTSSENECIRSLAVRSAQIATDRRWRNELRTTLTSQETGDTNSMSV